MTNFAPINFREKLSKIAEHWSPRVVAELNNYQFKLVKMQGEFVWHAARGYRRGVRCPRWADDHCL